MFQIDVLSAKYLDDVDQIEKECFSIPWSKEELKKEIETNPVAKYLVALDDNKNAIGYIGMWVIGDEGHITNIAVKEEKRNLGVGSFLLLELFKLAKFYNINAMTLEVRIGNLNAQKLYTKHGFAPFGIRKNYYTDTKEDAIIMWKYFEDRS